jgi:PHD/YefM family antitoxin component YafN of YafNO toxin-antitoxin module
VSPKIEQILIEKLSKASASETPVTLKRAGKSLAVILSATEYQKFQAECETKLQHLKTELNGILSLVRSYTQRRSLAEVEAQLSTLRQEIEQEVESQS